MVILHVQHHSLQWRHNEYDGVSINQPHDFLFDRLFRLRPNKTSKLRWPINFPHKWPVARKMFPFDDVIMTADGFTTQRPSSQNTAFSVSGRLTHYDLKRNEQHFADDMIIFLATEQNISPSLSVESMWRIHKTWDFFAQKKIVPRNQL